MIRQLRRHSPVTIHLLPERTLNGIPVYPIQVDASPPLGEVTVTYYFDARIYILRGLSAVPPTKAGFADVIGDTSMLVSYRIVPLSVVPAHTFQPRPPSGNQVFP